MLSVSLVVLISTLLKSGCCARAPPAASRIPRKTSRLVCFMARTIDPRSDNAAPRARNGLLRKSRRPTLASGPAKPRQRPTLPQGCPCSTIGPEKLNFRVRDGNGCDLFGIAARKKNDEVRSSAGPGIPDRKGQQALQSCDGSADDRLHTQVIAQSGCSLR